MEGEFKGRNDKRAKMEDIRITAVVKKKGNLITSKIQGLRREL